MKLDENLSIFSVKAMDGASSHFMGNFGGVLNKEPELTIVPETEVREKRTPQASHVIPFVTVLILEYLV